MATETQAVSSPAAEEDVFHGETPTLEEYNKYRESGEVPSRFRKPDENAASAPADSQKKAGSEVQGTESSGEAEAPNESTQEQTRKPRNAAQRIAQLEAAIEAEWDKEDPDVVRIGQLNATIDKINGRPKRKSEVAPPQVQPQQQNQPQSEQRAPQNYAEWESAFDPDKWIADFVEKNPTATYERATASMFNYMQGAREHFREIEQRIAQEKAALDNVVEDARERYEDFDEIKSDFLGKVISPEGAPLIPLPVLALINDSENLADVIYTIGSDETALEKFVEMAKRNPNQAIRYVARVESLIADEFAKSSDEAGESTQNAPEQKRTSAPRPPSPVGGSSARTFDVSDESLSADAWMQKRNKQLGIG